MTHKPYDKFSIAFLQIFNAERTFRIAKFLVVEVVGVIKPMRNVQFLIPSGIGSSHFKLVPWSGTLLLFCHAREILYTSIFDIDKEKTTVT